MERGEERIGRDHGGNLDAAIARFGGLPAEWIDLSTGINRAPYPLPALPLESWLDLPTAKAEAELIRAAHSAYKTDAAILPLAGASAAIQLLPRLRAPGLCHILAPTYNEHKASFAAAGWQVRDRSDIAALRGAEAAIAVNPNNPDGRRIPAQELRALKADIPLLIIDESFMDPTEEDSLAPHLGEPGLIVLRSFGKFYGLAGLRLGFALGNTRDIADLKEAAGPWQVSGPALHIGTKALADGAWQAQTRSQLAKGAARLRAGAEAAGWRYAGGTSLFVLFETPGARAAQEKLAAHRIWSRIFPYSQSWIRLGLPGTEEEWARLEAALQS